MAVGKRTPFSKAALCFAAFTLASRYVFTYLCLYEHSFYLADSLFFDNGIIAPDSFPFLTDASFQLKRLVGFTGFLEQKSCFAPAYGCSKGVLLLEKNIGTKTTASPLICAGKCVTLSSLEARPWPGNFCLWEDRYGLLSSCRYDGADRLRARGRRGGDVPGRGDHAPCDRGIWHGGTGVCHPELCCGELRDAEYEAADHHEARGLPWQRPRAH